MLVDGLGARVELALAGAHLRNWLTQMHAQWRQHAFNALALSGALIALFWRSVSAPAPQSWQAYANWSLTALCIGYFLVLTKRVRGELGQSQSDWLSVQPIMLSARLRWLRTRAALRASGALLLLGAVQGYCFGIESGARLWLIGALGSALIIQIAPLIPLSNQRRDARSLVQLSYANPHRAALQAWFYSAVMSAARMRWWWLVVALLVPMSSSLLLIAALALLVAATLRAYAVVHACAHTLHHASVLLQSQPMRPSLLYRAAGRFLLGALMPSLAVLVTLLLLLCLVNSLSLWLVPAAIVLGMLVAGSALHFAFGHRHEPLRSLRRTRTATLLCISLALFAQMLMPLLPLLCLALWRYHYLRGQRALEPQ